MPDAMDDLFTDEELAGEAGGEAGEAGEAGGAGGEGGVAGDIAEASRELADLGIVVEPSADAEEFLRHLCTALKTHKSTKALHGGGEPPPADEGAGGEGEGAPPPAAEPEAVGLSLAGVRAQLAALRRELAEERLAKRLAEVRRLERAGVVPRARAARWCEVFQARRLSLAGGRPDPAVAEVLAQMELARELGRDRIRLSGAAAEREPEWARWDPRGDDVRRQEEAGDALASMAGAPRKAK
jgi:hypothetical protein